MKPADSIDEVFGFSTKPPAEKFCGETMLSDFEFEDARIAVRMRVFHPGGPDDQAEAGRSHESAELMLLNYEKRYNDLVAKDNAAWRWHGVFFILGAGAFALAAALFRW